MGHRPHHYRLHARAMRTKPVVRKSCVRRCPAKLFTCGRDRFKFLTRRKKIIHKKTRTRCKCNTTRGSVQRESNYLCSVLISVQQFHDSSVPFVVLLLASIELVREMLQQAANLPICRQGRFVSEQTRFVTPVGLNKRRIEHFSCLVLRLTLSRSLDTDCVSLSRR